MSSKIKKTLISSYEDFIDQQTKERKKRTMTIYKLEWSIPAGNWGSLVATNQAGSASSTILGGSVVGSNSGSLYGGGTVNWPSYSYSSPIINIEYHVNKSKAEAKQKELKDAAALLKIAIYPTITEINVID